MVLEFIWWLEFMIASIAFVVVTSWGNFQWGNIIAIIMFLLSFNLCFVNTIITIKNIKSEVKDEENEK